MLLKKNISWLTGLLNIAVIVVFAGCSSQQKNTPALSNKDITKVMNQMTDVMVHDITNPPLAARFFAYSCLAGYEVVSQHDKNFSSMHGVLNDYPVINKIDTIDGYDYQLAAVLAMLETAKKMQPSGIKIDSYETAYLDSCKAIGFDETLIENSKRYAKTVSKQILAYAKGDKYNLISNLPRYAPAGKEGTWFPTPPGFLAAVEPNFNTVRPFLLDSAAQFKPGPPVAYNKGKSSAFYRLAEAVYKEGNVQDSAHIAIAAFWDCNPFAIQDQGHLMYGFKKISPGAHWLGITGIACEKAKKSFNESMKIFTVVSTGLMDAFMCCWDEKYRSNRIRPETVIRQLIDPTWAPLLQTPPFPEYLSGHSTISACSATILTKFFGENFAYTDSVEVPYGLPPRSFGSFNQASDEAGISRFYGGIHYMDAIENGRLQGIKVGGFIIDKMKL